MSVKVTIPVDIRHFTGGMAEVEAEGSTVGEILRNVVKRYPRLSDILFTADGQLDEFTRMALNQRVLVPQDNPLATGVASGDKIAIIIPLAGG